MTGFARIASLVATLTLAAGVAGATPPDDTARELEQAAVEELVVDGVVLSDHGVRLEVELIGERAIVSLIDLTTGRASASTKIAALPADSVAATALIRQVATTLVEQLDVRIAIVAPITPTPAPDPLPRPVLAPPSTALTIQLDVEKLAPLELYAALHRPDLIERLHRRRRWAGRLWVTTGVFAASALSAWIAASVQSSNIPTCPEPYYEGLNPCDRRAAGFQRADRYTLASQVLGGAAVLTGVAAAYLQWTQPISSSEAEQLAHRHNARLQARARVLPYAEPGGGGLALAGQF
jgi:hypothetical protein